MFHYPEEGQHFIFPPFPSYCFLIPLFDSSVLGMLASKKMTKMNPAVPLGLAASLRAVLPWRETLPNQPGGALRPLSCWQSALPHFNGDRWSHIALTEASFPLRSF